MNSFLRFTSKKSAKGVIGEPSDKDLSLPRTVEVRPCEWPHYPFLDATGIRQEFEQYVANAGLTDFLADECEQYCILTNTFVQSFRFLSNNNPPAVEFRLYAELHQMSLAEFCNVCLIPFQGNMREPRPAAYDDFFSTLSVGDLRRVSKATPAGLHFPAVRYFAIFIAKCLLAREKVSALSAPDLAVLHQALYGDNSYNIGAIVARRLHLNRSKGKIHGGIYATRLAVHFNVQIREHDPRFPKVYLDRQSMIDHHFLDATNTTCEFPYNIVFSVTTRDVIPLPAPALFNSIARGGYRIMPADIIAYRNPPVEEEPQEWDAHVPAQPHFEMGPDGYYGW